MRKIRVLQLVDDLKVGGLEQIIYDIATKLDQNKYRVSVWCFGRGGEIADRLKENRVDVKFINIDSYYNILNILKLAILVKKYEPDIIHSHTYFSNTIGRIAGIISRVPVMISHVHNVYSNYSKRNLLIERLLSNYTDKVICCSEAVRNFVLKYEKINMHKTVIIYNGVNHREIQRSQDISYLREFLGIYKNVITIICVASLTEKKGHEYLLKAILEIEKEFQKLKFIIVGDGPLKKRLKNLAEELNIQDLVIFTGIRNDIPNLLKIADIFVLPSLTEGLPLAAIEAMSVGLPVVATAVGGVPEIIKDGITGYLVPPKNPKALGNTILNLIKDKKNMEKVGLNGKKVIIENFTTEKMINKLEKLYVHCLHSNQT